MLGPSPIQKVASDHIIVNESLVCESSTLMDHIPFPTHPCNEPIKVPYLASKYPNLTWFRPEVQVSALSEEGDNDNDEDGNDEHDNDSDNDTVHLYPATLKFLSFPDLLDFDTNAIEDGDFADRFLEEVLCCMQSWCFFGLLASIMALSGIEVSEDQLLKRSFAGDRSKAPTKMPMVSTEILPSLLCQMEGISKPGKVDEEEMGSIYKECLLCLRTVSIFMREVNLSRDLNSPFRGNPSNSSVVPSLRDKVLLSIFLLGDFLHYAVMLWRPPGADPTEPEWGKIRYFPFLRQRLLEAGWCPSEIDLLDDQPTGLSTMYYLSSLDRKPLGKDHRACISLERFACKYERLTSYETAHASDCRTRSNLEFVDISHFSGPALHQIVNDEQIPVITVRADGTQFQGRLDALPVQSSGDHSKTQQIAPYIAFSHVWQE